MSGEKMTAEQRANAVQIKAFELWVLNKPKDLQAEILKQIKSAEEAAREETLTEGMKNRFDCRRHSMEAKSEGFQRGQREMREKAMRIPAVGMSCFECITRIRAIPIDSGERKS